MSATTGLYDTLGVAPDASSEEIKKAYRKRARQTHPDAGGTDEAFYEVQRAYEILSNAVTRGAYNESGEPTNEDQLLWGDLGLLITTVIDRAENINTVKLMDEVHALIDMKIQGCVASIGGATARIDKYHKAIQRLSNKKSNNMMVKRLEDVVREQQVLIEKAESEIKYCRKLHDIANEHEYKADDPFVDILKRGGTVTFHAGSVFG
jgi:curved DNA-binding protein CbpA